MMTSENAFTMLMLERLCQDLRAQVERQQQAQTAMTSRPVLNTSSWKPASAVISVLWGICIAGVTFSS